MGKKDKSPKFYCVWIGVKPGVYATWNDAQLQIKGYAGAKFMSFKTRQEAETAFRNHWQDYYEPPKEGMTGGKKKPTLDDFLDKIDANSIAVDAACSGNPGKMEYRGVWTLTGEEIFRSEVYPVGTNNIGEFLALVHGLALFHEKQPNLTIYSDSELAIKWIPQKKCKTKLPRVKSTEKLFTIVDRAETWLKTHTFTIKIKKWPTKEWGEIPADFGRK